MLTHLQQVEASKGKQHFQNRKRNLVTTPYSDIKQYMHDNNLSLNQLIDNEIIQNDGEIQKLITKVNNQTP